MQAEKHVTIWGPAVRGLLVVITKRMVAVSKSFVHISIWCTTFEILIILICHAAILSLYTMITIKVGTTHCWNNGGDDYEDVDA